MFFFFHLWQRKVVPIIYQKIYKIKFKNTWYMTNENLWQRKVVPMQELSIAWSVNNLSKNIKCNKICMMCQVCQVFKTCISTVKVLCTLLHPEITNPIPLYNASISHGVLRTYIAMKGNAIKWDLITFYPRTPFPAPWNIFQNNKYIFILHNQC